MKAYPCPKCAGETSLAAGRYECRAPECGGSLDKMTCDMLETLESLAMRSRPLSRSDYSEFVWKERVAPSLLAHGVSKEHLYRLPLWKCQPQEAAFRITKELCRGVGAIVALVGIRGCGKTTIAAQLLTERALAWQNWFGANPDERTGTQPPDVGFLVKLHRLSSFFKAHFSDFGSIGGEATADLYSRWCKEPLLIIDEIHEVEDMKASSRMLTDLLDQRYSGKRDTVIISNQSAADFKRSINPSILSRITQYGRVIPCEWESHRAKKTA